MNDREVQPIERLPPEPLRRIDWLAVAPWTLVARAPGATVGWPLLFGAVGLVLLTPNATRVVHETDLHETALASLPVLVDAVLAPVRDSGFKNVAGGAVGYALGLLGWLVLGVLTIDQASGPLRGGPRRSLGSSLRRTWRHTRRVVGGLALMLLLAAPFVVALWLYSIVPGVQSFSGVGGVLAAIPRVLLATPIAVLLIVSTAGAPLLVSAVVLDDADAFDAVSRTFAYSLQRLLTLAWCVVVVAAVGFLSGLLLEGAYRVALGVLQGFLLVDTGPEAERAAYLQMTYFAKLTHGFYPAYHFVAGAAVYLVMRHAVDGQPLDEAASPAGQSAAA